MVVLEDDAYGGLLSQGVEPDTQNWCYAEIGASYNLLQGTSMSLSPWEDTMRQHITELSTYQ